MSKVYIVNAKNNLDYNDAKRFGDLVPITLGNINIVNPQKMLNTINKKLFNYEREDYLLLSGNSLAVYAVTSWLFLNRSYNYYKVLIYNSRTGKYIAHEINTTNYSFSE